MTVIEKISGRIFSVFLVTVSVAAPAGAVPYDLVLSWNDIKGTGGSKALYATVVDGDTAYNFLSLVDTGSDSGRITKVTGIGGAKTYSELLSTSTWQTASGGAGLAPFYGAELINSGGRQYLQFGETGSDAIWRVGTSDGILTKYVSAEQIRAYTGKTTTQLLSPAAANPTTGEQYFYEGASKSILNTAGAGVIQTFIGDAQLTTLTGNNAVSGGITLDATGYLYWGSNTSDSLYKWNGSTGSTVLTTAQITSVTHLATAGFGDIYLAPNGLIYFYETEADSILSFNPSNPSGTLTVALSEADLNAGPEGYDYVGQLGSYKGRLGWVPGTPSVNGYFVVPEPTSTALLSLGSLVALRRHRKKRRPIR